MKKYEYKIGEEFQLGLKRLRVEEGSACEDCFFSNRCVNYALDAIDIAGGCLPTEREDKTNVIFKEVGEE